MEREWGGDNEVYTSWCSDSSQHMDSLLVSDGGEPRLRLFGPGTWWVLSKCLSEEEGLAKNDKKSPSNKQKVCLLYNTMCGLH